MAKDPDTITKIHGGKVTIELEEWERMWRRLEPAITAARAAGGGGCDDACAGHGGCDLEAGDPPERVWLCGDGHVILEDETV